MIVDLIRNDLGKICDPGSIQVKDLYRVVSFKTVHHMVSKIFGNIQINISEVDIIKAMFPGGSITGAPKESAMKIIDELENYSRDLYTGSIGYIKSNGDSNFNISIRNFISMILKSYFSSFKFSKHWSFCICFIRFVNEFTC